MRNELYKTNTCRAAYPEKKLKNGVNYLISIRHKIYTGSNSEAENTTPEQTKIPFAVERILGKLACHYRIKYLQFSHCLSTR